MAAAEGAKVVEGKTADAKHESKEAAVVVEENPEPALQGKTWHLKVSVHCEGCKRKVKKILHNIDGVYTVDVDLKQQKATVYGNVDGEALVKKLIKKTGKHAELWPDQKPSHKSKKKGKSKNKDKDKQQTSDQESGEEGGAGGGGGEQNKDNNKDQKVKTGGVVHIQDPSKVAHSHESGGEGAKAAAAEVKEVTKSEVKESVISPAADKKCGVESESGGGGSGSGTGGKKKKKKGQKGNNANNDGDGEHSGGAPAPTGSPSHGQGPVSSPYPTNPNSPHPHFHQYPPHYNGHSPYPASHSPPRHHYEQPTFYYAPHSQTVMSYSTARPSTSYGASYYAPPYEYAYIHPGTEDEHSPYDLYPPSQPSDSFEILSDENPNACSVM